MHRPVLLAETISSLAIAPTDCVIDATMGYGGHSQKIIEELIDPSGRLIGIDQDLTSIAHCQEKFKDTSNMTIVHGNFSNIDTLIQPLTSKPVNKIMADLGMSSVHLDTSKRGFSFQKSEPLDMRMNELNPHTAADLLNHGSAEKLLKILKEYGELNRPDRFVEIIISTRKAHPYLITDDLIVAIKKGFYFRNSRSLYMRTCAQVFQAIRMAVNNEVGVLTSFLEKSSELLAPEGRIAIITFHSIEDRIVKNHFASLPNFKMATKKVVKPNQTEVKHNSRCRSAKLRTYIKMTDEPTA